MFKFASKCPCGLCANLDSVALTIQVEIEKNLTNAGITGEVKGASERFAILAAIYAGKTIHDLIEDFSTASELLVVANKMDDRDRIQDHVLSKLIDEWDERADINAAEIMDVMGITKPDKAELN